MKTSRTTAKEEEEEEEEKKTKRASVFTDPILTLKGTTRH